MKTVAASLVGALAFTATTALAAVAPVAEKRADVTPITVKGNGTAHPSLYCSGYFGKQRANLNFSSSFLQG